MERKKNPGHIDKAPTVRRAAPLAWHQASDPREGKKRDETKRNEEKK